jgi:DmsE family decaheme c-type cytochrome
MNERNSSGHTSVRIVAMLAGVMCFALSGPALAAEDEAPGKESPKPAAEYSRGSKLCLACHNPKSDRPAHEILLTKMGTTADPSSPFADGNHQCETCHGPAKSHTKRQKDGTRLPPPMTFSKQTPADEKNAVCLGCHDDGARFHWMGSTHDIQETACVDCHQLHTENDPVLSLDTQPGVCFTCHQEQRAQLMRQSRHPVQTGTDASSHIGLMSCTDCHNPHGSTGPGDLVQNTVNETCYECHAEKRGPFVWEHQPAREDCGNCHTPHGSNYQPLLKGRAPWLCQQCHSTAFHPSTAYSGSGIPPGGASPQVLAGQCMNCHQQVHGSNHPSGLKQTR